MHDAMHLHKKQLLVHELARPDLGTPQQSIHGYFDPLCMSTIVLQLSFRSKLVQKL